MSHSEIEIPTGNQNRLRLVLYGSITMFVCSFVTFVAWVVWGGLHSRVEYRNAVQSIQCNKTFYGSGMQWKRERNGKWDLLHGYILKQGTSGGCGTTNNPRASYGDTKKFRETHPSRNSQEAADIDMYPQGMWVNGQRMVTSKSVRVFVVGQSGKTTPVQLTDEELLLFHPDVYPYSLAGSELWTTKFRPLVDPDRIEYEREQAAKAAENAYFETRKKLGVTFDRVYGPREGELIYYSDFDGYPNGTSRLLNAFFTSETVVSFTMLHTDLWKRVYTNPDPNRLPGYRCAYLESYPSFYVINGDQVERNKVYVQLKNGKVESLNLSEQEYRQCTKELFASPEKLKASTIYREKIAPAIGVSVDRP